jgi:hypothetical protein
MRVMCFQTWALPPEQQQLWLCAEAFSAGPITACNRFYIREDRVAWALLIDPHMRHIRNMDYYL